MSKKCWLITVAVLVAIAIAIAIPALLPPTPGVTYSNYSRLEKGMTRAQLEALLGEPDPALQGFGPDGDTSFLWESAEHDSVWITFDPNGLTKSYTWNHTNDERNSFQKAMERLPWFSKPPPPPIRK
jgi:outer membrane protein assembly factor BamE (lipoprotein component of BamABCDE complex)